MITTTPRLVPSGRRRSAHWDSSRQDLGHRSRRLGAGSDHVAVTTGALGPSSDGWAVGGTSARPARSRGDWLIVTVSSSRRCSASRSVRPRRGTTFLDLPRAARLAGSRPCGHERRRISAATASRPRRGSRPYARSRRAPARAVGASGQPRSALGPRSCPLRRAVGRTAAPRSSGRVACRRVPERHDVEDPRPATRPRRPGGCSADWSRATDGLRVRRGPTVTSP